MVILLDQEKSKSLDATRAKHAAQGSEMREAHALTLAHERAGSRKDRLLDNASNVWRIVNQMKKTSLIASWSSSPNTLDTCIL